MDIKKIGAANNSIGTVADKQKAVSSAVKAYDDADIDRRRCRNRCSYRIKSSCSPLLSIPIFAMGFTAFIIRRPAQFVNTQLRNS